MRGSRIFPSSGKQLVARKQGQIKETLNTVAVSPAIGPLTEYHFQVREGKFRLMVEPSCRPASTRLWKPTVALVS